MPEYKTYFTLTPAELAGYEVETESKPSKAGKRDKKSADKEAPGEIQENLETLQQALDQRAAEFGLPSFQLEKPPLPPDLSEEHLKVLSEIFGADNLEAVVCPQSKDLTDSYFGMMYPTTQRNEDQARGLVSCLPSWWNNKMDRSISLVEEKVGDAYVRSMKSEAVQLQDAVFLTESIQKPQFIDGSQHYGDKAGMDDSKDSLLPMIKEVFGAEANRFNLTWDQLAGELLPKVKEKIQNIFRSKHLPEFEFDVVLTPAVISNIQTTLVHPLNSQTNTYEWTSTVLLKQDGTDSGSRLMVGFSDLGGAGCVDDDQRGNSWNDRGFRLSVVLKKP